MANGTTRFRRDHQAEAIIYQRALSAVRESKYQLNPLQS